MKQRSAYDIMAIAGQTEWFGLCVLGWTSSAQQEGRVAQTAVQAEEASSGCLLQDGTALQLAQVCCAFTPQISVAIE